MRILLFIITIGFPYLVVSQNIMHGYITDKQSGEALIGANVYFAELKNGTITNTYGFYTISIPNGIHKLSISYVGYNKIDTIINAKKELNYNFQLNQLSLNEIIIIGDNQNENLNDRIEMGKVGLNIESIKSLPCVFGELDIMKTIALTPGIKLGIEGMTGLSIRGGSPDQNYILLDDAPVYNPAHLFGFISIFNADAIKSFDIWKSSFPSRYGGRLSSIIDIKMKEGTRKNFRADLGIGLFASRLVLEGPINNKSSYIISARSSYLDLFTLPLKLMYKSGKADTYFNYRMLDINTKINYSLSTKSKIFLSYYQGIDNMAQESNSFISEKATSGGGLDWGNRTITLRYYKELNPTLFFNSILYSSNFFQKTFAFESIPSGDNIKDFEFKNKTGLSDYGAKFNVEYLFKDNHYIKAGIDFIYHRFSPINLSSIDKLDTLTINRSIIFKNLEGAAFVEDEFTILDKLSSNIGLRLSGTSLNPGININLEPRLSLKYDLPMHYSFKCGVSKINQYINWAIGAQTTLPFDIWVPATKDMPGQSAWHFGFGIDKTFTKSNIDFSFELYLKKMSGLVELNEGLSSLVLFATNNSLSEIVANNGIGKSYGAEIFLHKKIGNFNGWLSYSLSWNNRKFENLNNGKWYPHVFDRRHEIALVANYTINTKWNFSANWVYNSGNRVTVPTASYYPEWSINSSSIPEPEFIFGEKNNGKMSPYHRLDISIAKTWSSKRLNTKTFQFSLYNVYNRANAMRLFPVKVEKYDNNHEIIGYNYKMVERSFLPILPSFTFSIKFDRVKSENIYYEPKRKFEF